MTWAKFDDKFHAHPKALKAGLAGCGLFLRAVTYCCDHLTDGFVPEEWVGLQTGSAHADVPDTMVAAGLWREAPGGFEIIDFLEFNPSWEQVKARREKAKRAGRLGGLQKAAKVSDAADRAKSLAERQPIATPSATETLERSLNRLPSPNRTGNGGSTETPEEQQDYSRQVADVIGIFAQFDLTIDEVSVENCLARGRGVDGLDHLDLARACAEWCSTHERPPAPTFHRFIDTKLRDLAELRDAEKDKPKPSQTVPDRDVCVERGCGERPVLGNVRCRAHRDALEARLTGEEVAV